MDTICRWHDCLHIESQGIHQKTPRTSEFSKIVGYKINTQKSITFLYTNYKNVETEIRSKIPFTIAPRKWNINLKK